MSTPTGPNPPQADIPQIISKTRYISKDYEIVVGFVKDGEIPQYLVLNKETGVVEFNNEVLAFVREWVAHFQERLDQLNEGKKPTNGEAQDQYTKADFN